MTTKEMIYAEIEAVNPDRLDALHQVIQQFKRAEENRFTVMYSAWRETWGVSEWDDEDVFADVREEFVPEDVGL